MLPPLHIILRLLLC